MSDYQEWIDQNYPTQGSAVAQCVSATRRMVEQFPELRVVKGTYKLPWHYRRLPHCWCVAPDGTIVDPTLHQWGTGLEGGYRSDPEGESPVGKCMNCGDHAFASTGGKSHSCSDECRKMLKTYYGDVERKARGRNDRQNAVRAI